MGVIRFGLEEYLVKFDNSYSEELYAIQGETARSYIFTLTNMDGKIEDSTNIDLYMTLNIKNKSNIIKGISVLEIEIEKEIEKAKRENQTSSSKELEEIIENIRNSEELKEKYKGKFLVKIPQWYLHESDKNAIYQMFIVERSENALLAQKEGKFIVYPNRNYESKSVEDESIGENLLVDFHEYKMYMDKVIEIGEKYEKIYDVVSKADKIESLYELLNSLSKGDEAYFELLNIVNSISAAQGEQDGKMEALKTELKDDISKLNNRIFEEKRISCTDGFYIIYSNGYCEYYGNRYTKLELTAEYPSASNPVARSNTYRWTFPIKFNMNPHVSVECAISQTGASWGFSHQAQKTFTDMRIIDFVERAANADMRIEIKVSGFVNKNDYENLEYKPLNEIKTI